MTYGKNGLRDSPEWEPTTLYPCLVSAFRSELLTIFLGSLVSKRPVPPLLPPLLPTSLVPKSSKSTNPSMPCPPPPSSSLSHSSAGVSAALPTAVCATDAAGGIVDTFGGASRAGSTFTIQCSNCSSSRLSNSSPSLRLATRTAPSVRSARSVRLAAALKFFSGYSELPHPKTE